MLGSKVTTLEEAKEIFTKYLSAHSYIETIEELVKTETQTKIRLKVKLEDINQDNLYPIFVCIDGLPFLKFIDNTIFIDNKLDFYKYSKCFYDNLNSACENANLRIYNVQKDDYDGQDIYVLCIR